MQSIEAKLNEALVSIKEKDALILSLKQVIHKKSLIIATMERNWMLKEARVSPESAKRLHAAFANSTNNSGLREAINVELRAQERTQ